MPMVGSLTPLFLFVLSSIIIHHGLALISPLARSQPFKTRVLLSTTSASITSTPKLPISSTTMSKTGSKGPVFEAEEVQYDVSRPSGRILEGTLTVPKDSKREGRILVFLHGTHSNRNHNFVPELCTKLVKDHGISSYRFDFRVGPTTAEPDHRYKFSGYNDDVNDLECVIQSLVQTGYTICGIFGHSRGANDALLYASSRLIQGDGNSVGDDNRACADTVFQQITSQASSSSSASASAGTSSLQS